VIRFSDTYGVMHWARGGDPANTALCGSPPAGNTWADKAPFIRGLDGSYRPTARVEYDPAAPAPPHKAVCPTCYELSRT
jgi:hypothetical protein